MSSLYVVPPALASQAIYFSLYTLQSSLVVSCTVSRVNSCTLQGGAGRCKPTLSYPDQRSWSTTVPILVFSRCTAAKGKFFFDIYYWRDVIKYYQVRLIVV